jgi:hypothetical protein
LTLSPAKADKKIAGDVKGSDLIGEIEKAIRLCEERLNVFGSIKLYMVKLQPKEGKGGHAIGLRFPDSGKSHLHFFDSNFGEFGFLHADTYYKVAFLNEWWRFYRGTFGRWELVEIEKNAYANASMGGNMAKVGSMIDEI